MLTQLVSNCSLFRVDRNRCFSETVLLDDTIQRLRARLPATWRLESESLPASRIGPDARLQVSGPNGSTATIAVDVKSARPVRILSLLEQLRRIRENFPGVALLAVAPYLSPSIRTILARDGVGYADSTGNLRLAIDEPALFIETAGVDRDPWPDGQQLRSLRGAAAGRAVRAFCDFTPPYGIRRLAERAGVPAPTLSRVANLLEREGILRTERSRGPIIGLDWQAAIRRWAEDYTFTKSNTTSSWLEPRGLPALLDKLREADLQYAITGSLAANVSAPITAPRIAALYTDNTNAIGERFGLRRAETGANVLLAEPFDPVVFVRGFRRDNLRYAAYSQTAIDLLTGPGRWPAEGEALLGWMQANESVWRA